MMRNSGRCRSGNATVEFAVMAPIMLVLFVGIADIGGLLMARFRLDAVLNETTAYALSNAKKVNATDGAALGQNMAALARSDPSTSSATVSIVVNNGPRVMASGTGAPISSGNAINADRCYCPSAAPFAFGAAAASCSAACADGAAPGKFVQVAISRAYVPIFSTYGIAVNGKLSAGSVVQVD